jgi:hypothetical protein
MNPVDGLEVPGSVAKLCHIKHNKELGSEEQETSTTCLYKVTS